MCFSGKKNLFLVVFDWNYLYWSGILFILKGSKFVKYSK